MDRVDDDKQWIRWRRRVFLKRYHLDKMCAYLSFKLKVDGLRVEKAFDGLV